MGKAATDAAANAGRKMVLADCVSVLLMAVGNTTITKAQYNMMSAIDGTRTASSFEHQFRTITAKAKELKARVEDGEDFEPIPPTIKRSISLRSPVIVSSANLHRRWCGRCSCPSDPQETQDRWWRQHAIQEEGHAQEEHLYQ
jgi:hypothetical protein